MSVLPFPLFERFGLTRVQLDSAAAELREMVAEMEQRSQYPIGETLEMTLRRSVKHQHLKNALKALEELGARAGE